MTCNPWLPRQQPPLVYEYSILLGRETVDLWYKEKGCVDVWVKLINNLLVLGTQEAHSHTM